MEFKKLLTSYDLNSCIITIRNPHANTIFEYMHIVTNNYLYFLYALDLKEIIQDSDLKENSLIAVLFTINSTVNTTIYMVLGQLAFGRNIILHTSYVANW